MERLSNNAIEIINTLHTDRLDYSSEYLPLIEAANQLAAYEDTGLTPEEIVRMAMMYEDSKRYSGRLEGKLKAYEDLGYKPAELLAQLNTLAEYHKVADPLLRAKAEGRLIPPCELGDEAYGICRRNRYLCIKRGPVSEIYYTDGMRLGLTVKGVCKGEWGKTVFATHMEAVKALEEMSK